jgi:hypothetical protein
MLMERIILEGKFHDQWDTKWTVIRGQLRGHNDTPFGQPTPGQPIGRPGVGCPSGIFGVFSYYLLVILVFNIVPLIMESTGSDEKRQQMRIRSAVDSRRG